MAGTEPVLNSWLLSKGKEAVDTRRLLMPRELLFLFHTDDQASSINGNLESRLHDNSWVTNQALLLVKRADIYCLERAGLKWVCVFEARVGSRCWKGFRFTPEGVV